MSTINESKTRPVTGAESEFDHGARAMPRPNIRVNQSNSGSNSAFAYLIVALVLVVGGYYAYSTYYGSAPVATQGATTLPKSEIVVPVAPVPSTPPASSSAAPIVEPPAVAPATPATPPATTTTP